MPSNKRTRIQAYLDPELAELVRQRAREEDRAESREVVRLIRLGLEVDAQPFVLADKSFRTRADVATYVRSVCEATAIDTPVLDEAVLDFMRLDPEWTASEARGGWLSTTWSSRAVAHGRDKANARKLFVIRLTEHADGSTSSFEQRVIEWERLLPLLSRVGN